MPPVVCCGRAVGVRSADRTEQVNFAPGGQWDETSVGTNAIGLSLVLGRPVEVFADEHWCEAVKDWVCYSAPVRNAGGAVVGVIDLSTTWRRATEAGMSVVSGLARLAEHELSKVRLPLATRATLDLQLLGIDGSRCSTGFPLLLTPRQLDFLCILETREELSLDQLRVLVDGDRALSAATVRSELALLRQSHRWWSRPRPVPTHHRRDVGSHPGCASDWPRETSRRRSSRTADHCCPTPVRPRSSRNVSFSTTCYERPVLERGTTEQLLAFGRHHPDDRQSLPGGHRPGDVVGRGCCPWWRQTSESSSGDDRPLG